MRDECSRQRGVCGKPRSGTSSQRVLLGLVAAVFGLVGAPAHAQSVISWGDLTATKQVCGSDCVRSETWFTYEQCDFPCSGDCGTCSVPHYRCLEYAPPACHAERVPLPDGDFIDYSIEHGVVSPSEVQFRVVLGPNVAWWKQVRNRGGPDVWAVWTEWGRSWCNWPQAATAGCDSIGEWTGVLLNGAQEFVLSKAKFLGAHTDVYVLRDLPSKLRGGDRITFTWIRD